MDFLCIDYVNSSWYITHKLFADPLMDYEWLRSLADEWNIKSLPAPTEAELVSLMEMRSLFDQLLGKIIRGEKLEKSDIELINHYMIDETFYRKLQSEEGNYKLCDIPKSRKWKWFMAEVAASFSKLISSEAVNHLKICQNPECGWYFLDESKRENRKWCDDTCATLMKVRRFRERQKGK